MGLDWHEIIKKRLFDSAVSRGKSPKKAKAFADRGFRRFKNMYDRKINREKQEVQ